MKAQIKIIDVSWHRNGITGEGFYAVLFDDKETGRMIASLFDKPGYCAVYNVDELNKGNVKMAMGNSWRGDVFANQLRPLVKKYLKEHGTNKVGPFSI